MNCEIFNQRLPEYLDEALAAGELAAAREHVQSCDVCQRAVARQEAFAKSIRLSIEREIGGLSLAADTRRNILSAVTRPERRETFAFFWRHPVWVGAAVLALLISIGFIRVSKINRDVCVVDVPIRAEAHFYHRERGLVVDDMVTETTVIDAAYSENINHDKL
jgi:hypothetical protein